MLTAAEVHAQRYVSGIHSFYTCLGEVRSQLAMCQWHIIHVHAWCMQPGTKHMVVVVVQEIIDMSAAVA